MPRKKEGSDHAGNETAAGSADGGRPGRGADRLRKGRRLRQRAEHGQALRLLPSGSR